ncbi:uncharacterized protein LOC111862085 [Cryptotermes secundus]|uniref:uncharacterized protein LOC111862085 n=1 Tax=Cryptotermes secundus TaxID=105785 RepID=UPI000CD7B569|nr:uncharacterized protein LOC111862085 [Cryptotermes secundus]
MRSKLVLILAATLLVQVSFTRAGDAILEFQEQAQRDTVIFKAAREVEDELLKEFFELKVKVDRLLQIRQSGQEDPDLEASIQETAENIIRGSAEYFESETKLLEIARNDLHFVKALADQLKSRQQTG